MIEETFRKIESELRNAGELSRENREELQRLVTRLKSEVEAFDKVNPEHSRSIAGFAQISTHEAVRSSKEPRLLKHALDGLSASVVGFEKEHPQLTEVVQRIAAMLANMGI